MQGSPRRSQGSGSQTSACTGITWGPCYNAEVWAPPPELQIQQVCSWAWERAFLVQSQDHSAAGPDSDLEKGTLA